MDSNLCIFVENNIKLSDNQINHKIVLESRLCDIGYRITFTAVSYTHLTLPTNREV